MPQPPPIGIARARGEGVAIPRGSVNGLAVATEKIQERLRLVDDKLSRRLNEIQGTGGGSTISGALSSRPPAGTPNRIFVATDTGQQFLDTGVEWVLITSPPPGGVSESGTATFAAGQSSQAVTFSSPQPNAQYVCVLGVSGMLTTVQWANPTVNGFTLQLGAAPAVGQTVVVTWCAVKPGEYTYPLGRSGVVAFGPGESSKAVAFASSELDASYLCVLGVTGMLTTVQWRDPTVNGFTIDLGAAPGAGQTAVVSWCMVRPGAYTSPLERTGTVRFGAGESIKTVAFPNIELGATYLCVLGVSGMLTTVQWRDPTVNGFTLELGAQPDPGRTVDVSWGMVRVSEPALPSGQSGTVLFAAGESTKPVVFSTPEADVNYRIAQGVSALTTFAWANKTVNGFDFLLGVSPGVGQTITGDWIISR